MECKNNRPKKWRALSEARYHHKASRSRSPKGYGFSKTRDSYKEKMQLSNLKDMKHLEELWTEVKLKTEETNSFASRTMPIRTSRSFSLSEGVFPQSKKSISRYMDNNSSKAMSKYYEFMKALAQNSRKNRSTTRNRKSFGCLQGGGTSFREESNTSAELLQYVMALHKSLYADKVECKTQKNEGYCMKTHAQENIKCSNVRKVGGKPLEKEKPVKKGSLLIKKAEKWSGLMVAKDTQKGEVNEKVVVKSKLKGKDYSKYITRIGGNTANNCMQSGNNARGMEDKKYKQTLSTKKPLEHLNSFKSSLATKPRHEPVSTIKRSKTPSRLQTRFVPASNAAITELIQSQRRDYAKKICQLYNRLKRSTQV